MSDKPAESGAADIGPPDRDAIVDEAGRDLFRVATEWRSRWAITEAEISYILGVLITRHVQQVCLEERKPKS